MRIKRTHRILCELLEQRRLLSSSLFYLDETTGVETNISNGGTITDAFTDIPLNVTGASESGSGGVDFGDTSTDAAIKAEWQWNFGDSGSEYNELNGFNAAHIYSNPGDYIITLNVTNQYGTQTPFTLNVDVTSEPFDDPSAHDAETVYVAENASGGGDGSDPADAMDLATLQQHLQGGDLSLISPDSQILFKDGDEFDLDSSFTSLNISQSNIEIGNYDTNPTDPSPDPLFVDDKSEYTLGDIFAVQSGAINVVFEHLDFKNDYQQAAKTKKYKGVGSL